MHYKNKMGGCGMDSPSSGQGPVARSCEHGNELSGSIRREICSLAERLLA
jgi:hypothetical protein